MHILHTRFNSLEINSKKLHESFLILHISYKGPYNPYFKISQTLMKNTFYFTYNAPLVLDEFKCFEFFILLALNLKVSQMI